MKCTKCKREVSSTNSFCPYCGNKINKLARILSFDQMYNKYSIIKGIIMSIPLMYFYSNTDYEIRISTLLIYALALLICGIIDYKNNKLKDEYLQVNACSISYSVLFALIYSLIVIELESKYILILISLVMYSIPACISIVLLSIIDYFIIKNKKNIL